MALVYLDSSALLKLAVREPESAALRVFLRGKTELVASSLAEARVAQASGRVLWIGVDSERIYWTMFRDATPGTVALVRRLRP